MEDKAKDVDFKKFGGGVEGCLVHRNNLSLSGVEDKYNKNPFFSEV